MSLSATNPTEGGSSDRDMYADTDPLINNPSTTGDDRASTKKSVCFDNEQNKTSLSTAIILINFQNEFVNWAGQLHSNVGDLMEKTDMMTKVPHVLRAAR